MIELKRGDITKEAVDAIVNAANTRLRGGGGVDGAIHKAGGPAVLEDCKRYPGCPQGQAVITTAGDMPAKHVIHTVGPIYRDGRRGESETLANAYRNSLKLAHEHGLKTVAFPSISTGVFGYPVAKAAQVALSTVKAFLQEHPDMRVRFVLFSDADLETYRQALEA